MYHRRLTSQMVYLIVVVMLLSSCATSQPTLAPVPPTSTSIPFTPTALPPTPTSIPPTATEAPTATATVKPSATPSLSPSPRGYVSIAYDIESDKIILFGGQLGSGNKISGETWAYDVAANKWTEMKPPSGPTERSVAALAYDAESDRIILFGGGGKSKWDLGDTWAYDYNANTWTEMAKGPEKHLGPRIAYDAQSDRIILFGGWDMSNYYYNDTWAYDFNSDTWTEMKPSTSPPGRNYQAMTYDSKADRVLVWGGLDLEGKKAVDYSVWSYNYNQNTWQEKKPADTFPGSRDYAVMVYDAESDRTILFGGFPLGGDETWAYDYNTNTWTNMKSSPVPGKLSRHAMAYSIAADRVVLFGGQNGPTLFKYTGETWIYDFNSNSWTNVTQ